MVIDPAMVLATIPHDRQVHFWAKNDFFQNKWVGKLFSSAGVVPVDRTTRNNQLLFKATFETLEKGGLVAVFPEGTSATLPHLLPIKDGASWAALEFAHKLSQEGKLKEESGGAETAVIIPVGITYTDKSRFRSDVIVRYGDPITVDSLLYEFEKDPRATVKKLTGEIEKALYALTINAPDWDILNAAKLARIILFCDKDPPYKLQDYVKVSQSFINFFKNPSDAESPQHNTIKRLQKDLLTYNDQLQQLNLTDFEICKYSKDRITPVSALTSLTGQFLSLFLQAPFFLPGLIIHLPVYALGKLVALREKYEESRSQDKVFIALALLPLLYSLLFYNLWSWTGFSLRGFWATTIIIPTILFYHYYLLDERYAMFKKFIKSWRIFKVVVLLKLMRYGKRDSSNFSPNQIDEMVKLRERCFVILKNIFLRKTISNGNVINGVSKSVSQHEYYNSSNSSTRSFEYHQPQQIQQPQSQPQKNENHQLHHQFSQQQQHLPPPTPTSTSVTLPSIRELITSDQSSNNTTTVPTRSLSLSSQFSPAAPPLVPLSATTESPSTSSSIHLPAAVDNFSTASSSSNHHYPYSHNTNVNKNGNSSNSETRSSSFNHHMQEQMNYTRGGDIIDHHNSSLSNLMTDMTMTRRESLSHAISSRNDSLNNNNYSYNYHQPQQYYQSVLNSSTPHQQKHQKSAYSYPLLSTTQQKPQPSLQNYSIATANQPSPHHHHENPESLTSRRQPHAQYFETPSTSVPVSNSNNSYHQQSTNNDYLQYSRNHHHQQQPQQVHLPNGSPLLNAAHSHHAQSLLSSPEMGSPKSRKRARVSSTKHKQSMLMTEYQQQQQEKESYPPYITSIPMKDYDNNEEEEELRRKQNQVMKMEESPPPSPTKNVSYNRFEIKNQDDIDNNNNSSSNKAIGFSQPEIDAVNVIQNLKIQNLKLDHPISSNNNDHNCTSFSSTVEDKSKRRRNKIKPVNTEIAKNDFKQEEKVDNKIQFVESPQAISFPPSISEKEQATLEILQSMLNTRRASTENTAVTTRTSVSSSSTSATSISGSISVTNENVISNKTSSKANKVDDTVDDSKKKKSINIDLPISRPPNSKESNDKISTTNSIESILVAAEIVDPKIDAAATANIENSDDDLAMDDGSEDETSEVKHKESIRPVSSTNNTATAVTVASSSTSSHLKESLYHKETHQQQEPELKSPPTKTPQPKI
ncbi:12815_t:CDS:2, partial [Ambispora leptoticha]